MRKEYLILLTVAFIWGSGHPLGKIILKELHPIQLSLLSAFLTTTVLAAIMLASRKKTMGKLGSTGMLLSVAAGAIMFFIYPILSFSALRLIPASVNAILVSTSTIYVALIAAATLKERLNSICYAGIVFSFIGVSMVVLSSGGSVNVKSISLLGCGLSLLGALTSATYAVMGKFLMYKYEALTVTLISSASGAVLLAAATPLIGFSELATMSLKTLLLTLYWGVSSGVGYFLFYRCLKSLEATRVSSFIYFSPMFAILLSIILIQEKISILFILGMGLIFLGVRLAQRR